MNDGPAKIGLLFYDNMEGFIVLRMLLNDGAKRDKPFWRRPFVALNRTTTVTVGKSL